MERPYMVRQTITYSDGTDTVINYKQSMEETETVVETVVETPVEVVGAPEVETLEV